MKTVKTRLAASLAIGLPLLAPLRGPADTLYVSSVNGNKVYAVSAAGTVTPFANISRLPEGLAFDAAVLARRFSD